MLKLFQPAPVIDPLPKERVDKEYKKLRLQVFLGIFIGYACVHTFGIDSFGSDYDCYGSYPVDGQFAFYHAYVLHLICKWLGARYGLASVWPGDGSLVFCPGTRRKDVYMEYRS